jgi:excisionase family DNA binding protein
MLRDNDLGVVRARAFGIYDFKIIDPKVFLKEVAGTDAHFHLDEFADTMRSRIVSVFSEALAQSRVPVLDIARRYSELGESLLPLINPVMKVKYGLEISSFIVENVSVPPEVEQAIDKRASMSAIGNLNDYVKYQMAQNIGQAPSSGAGGMASELAIGLAMAKQISDQFQQPSAGAPNPAATAATPGNPPAGSEAAAGGAALDLLSPAQAAQMMGVSESDVMTSITSGDLKAKKIGTTYRISRSALDEFLK